MFHAPHDTQGPRRRWSGAVVVLLLTCAITILACGGPGENLVEATPPATTIADATGTATATAAPKPTSTPKPKPTATPIPFRVTGATVSVSPSHYTGGCVSATIVFTFTFNLLAHGPGGTISFYTSNPDGPPSGTMTVKVNAGQTTVTTTQTVIYDQQTIFSDETPWVQAHTTKPNSVSSTKANYVFTCLS